MARLLIFAVLAAFVVMGRCDETDSVNTDSSITKDTPSGLPRLPSDFQGLPSAPQGIPSEAQDLPSGEAVPDQQNVLPSNPRAIPSTFTKNAPV